MNAALHSYTVQENKLQWPFGYSEPARRKRGYWWQDNFIKAISNIFAVSDLNTFAVSDLKNITPVYTSYVCIPNSLNLLRIFVPF